MQAFIASVPSPVTTAVIADELYGIALSMTAAGRRASVALMLLVYVFVAASIVMTVTSAQSPPIWRFAQLALTVAGAMVLFAIEPPHSAKCQPASPQVAVHRPTGAMPSARTSVNDHLSC